VDESDQSLLTTNERETLRLALGQGYFAVPRETTVVDLSNELNRPDVQTSEEIRQGIATVLRRPNALEPIPADIKTDGGGSSRLDRMFDALKHPYRRRILELLNEHNPRDEDEFSVEELATEDDDLELLTTELYHVHLPKLVESGYVEWDEDDGVVRRGPNFEEIAPLLRLMSDHQDELPEGWP
jgi:DNA-binding transcriptional ArsR family regulator